MTYPFSGGMVLGTAVLQLVTDQREYEKGLQEAERKAEAAAKRAEADAKKMADNAASLGGKISLALGGASLAAFGLATKAAVDYESAFAGVRKTVDGTPAELQAISDGLRGMAREIPVNATGLAGIAEAAGQLGIEKSNILGFTRTMADLGVATNLTGEQAAVTFAQFANITQMSQGDFDRLGSTVVALGNNLATTEAQIADFGLRIAGAGEIAGLTEAEILAIGGAMASVGVEAEAGGTAVQKVLLDITDQVATGGDKLEIYAQTAGMTAQQFADAWRSDPGAAFTAFVEGLGQAGNDAFTILNDLDLTDQRLIRSFLSLAGAGDLLRDSIDLGNGAWEENTALTKEAEQRYATTASQLSILKNNLTDVGITFGSAVTPALAEGSEVLSGMLGLFGQLPASTQQLILMSTVLSGMAPLLYGKARAWSAAVAGMDAAQRSALKARLGLLGLAAGLTAVLAVADAILTTKTGDGLITHLLGKHDDNERQRQTLANIQRILGAFESPEGQADAFTRRIREQAAAYRELDDVVGDIAEKDLALGDLTGQIRDASHVAKQGTSDILGYFKALGETGQASVKERLELMRQFPPEMQKLIDAQEDLTGKYREQMEAHTAAQDAEILNLKRLKDEVIPVVSELHSKSNQFMRSMGDWEPVLRIVADATGETFDAWSGKIPPTIANMDELSAYLELEFGPDVAEAFDQMRENVQDAFDGVKGVYESILPATDETFSEWKKRIDKMVEDHLAFKGNLQTIYGEITAAGVAMPDALITALAEQGPAYVAMFAQWFAEDPEAALEGLKAAAPIITGESLDGILAEVKGAKPSLDGAWASTVTKPAEDAVEEAKRIMREEGPLIVAGLAGAVSSAEQLATASAAGSEVGMALQTGVAAGLAAAEARAAVVAEAKRVMDEAIDAMKAQGLIYSPSQVAAEEVGLPLAQGVAVGILAGKQEILDAAGAVVDQAIAKSQAEIDAFIATVGKGIQIGPDDWQRPPGGGDAPLGDGYGGANNPYDANGNLIGVPGSDWVFTPGKGWHLVPTGPTVQPAGMYDGYGNQMVYDPDTGAVVNAWDVGQGYGEKDRFSTSGFTLNNYGPVYTNDLEGTMGDIGFGLMDELGRRGLT